jgi:ParB family chromosome partitioning protein
VIARVKDDKSRAELLKHAVAKNLSLSDIRAKVQELKPEPELTPEKEVAQRLSEIGKRLQKSEVWSDRKKRDRITKLLDELDRLAGKDWDGR